MRGRACPEAWASPVPERVGPKVEANPHQSQLSRSGEEDWKRGRNVRTPAALARGALRLFHLTVQAIHGTERSLVWITLELDGGMVDMILLAEHAV
jgi:hypothetical protein